MAYRDRDQQRLRQRVHRPAGHGRRDARWRSSPPTASAAAIDQVLVASTGVIGVNLKMDKIRAGIPQAVAALAADGGAAAARAIMTTDPFPKEYAVEVDTRRSARSASAAWRKGSGMIEPRMATMLGYLTTDAAVEPAMLSRALTEASRYTFNAITVDGEPSTNDCVFALANGASGVAIDDESLSRAGRRRSAPWRTSSRSASCAAAKAPPS